MNDTADRTILDPMGRAVKTGDRVSASITFLQRHDDACTFGTVTAIRQHPPLALVCFDTSVCLMVPSRDLEALR